MGLKTGEKHDEICRIADGDVGGGSEFIRQYTLASGGPYCDCGYHKK